MYFSRSPYVVRARCDGATVLLEMRTGEVWPLDPATEVIWAALDGAATDSHIRTELGRALRLSESSAAEMATRILDELAGRTLVVCRPDGGDPS